ncbi:uncharacterized protein [Cicer arietinum]|uniref:uncharacterized protein isoform X2 n=1 Tax=Cicer arietinum TaxID=3827 RepID=UPI003CC647EC
MKQKHKWCSQLLTIFMKKTRDSYLGDGGKPLLNMSEPNIHEILKVTATLKSEDAKKSKTSKTEQERKAETLKSETPILTAARHGIVEMVNVLVNKIPSSIYETNLENKNILLVAVENRRTIVVESLKKWFEKRNAKPQFDNLIQWVDNENNTVLHLAATPSDEDWNISGAALQIIMQKD